MSTEIFLHGSEDGDTGPVLLASGAGWTDLGKWAKSLPGFPLLKELVDDGEIKDTLQLANELGQARDEHPIGDKDTDDVAAHLLETLGIGDPEEFATVLESGEEMTEKR